MRSEATKRCAFHGDKRRKSLTTLRSNVVHTPSLLHAQVLRSFVSNFFPCSVCQVHFLRDYDSCVLHRCDLVRDVPVSKEGAGYDEAKNTAVWMWETHNEVTARVKEEVSEELSVSAACKSNSNTALTSYEHPPPLQDGLLAVKWPSDATCPSCWYKEDGHEHYDKAAVYEFLRGYYYDVAAPTLREDLVVVNPMAGERGACAGNRRTARHRSNSVHCSLLRRLHEGNNRRLRRPPPVHDGPLQKEPDVARWGQA